MVDVCRCWNFPGLHKVLCGAFVYSSCAVRGVFSGCDAWCANIFARLNMKKGVSLAPPNCAMGVFDLGIEQLGAGSDRWGVRNVLSIN